MKIILNLLILLLLLSGISFADDKLGGITWTEKGPIVKAKGIGAVNPQMPISVQRPAVIEAAKVDALRKALEIIKGVNINSETTIENQMMTNDIMIKNSSGMIKNYTLGEPNYFSDGTVEIEVTVPLYKNKELMDIMLPKDKFSTENKKIEKSDAPYTGLVINCIDLGVMPALTFKILDQSNNELYSPKMVSKAALFDNEGMAGYVVTKKQALESVDRVGKNPLIIDAISASGKYKTDVTVSNKDAKKIKELKSLLSNCKVIIISNSY